MDSMDESNLARMQQLLEDTLEIAEENNRMLHSIQRTARWSFWGKLLIWIIVLALPFIVLGPFLHTLVPSIPGQSNSGIFGLPSADQVQSILNAYKQSTSTP